MDINDIIEDIQANIDTWIDDPDYWALQNEDEWYYANSFID